VEYLPALTVQSVMPTAVLSSDGGTVRVSGTGFRTDREMACRVGRVQVLASVLNSTQLLCQVPSSAAAGVQRAAIGVGFNAMDSVPFVQSETVSITYVSGPSVVQLRPSAGPFEGGSRVAVLPGTGQRFEESANGVSVDWQCIFRLDPFPGAAVNIPVEQNPARSIAVPAALQADGSLVCVSPPTSRGPRIVSRLPASVHISPLGSSTGYSTGLTFTYSVGIVATRM